MRELGNYRYQMESVSDERPAGCPGQTSASDKHPWLSPAELKALRQYVPKTKRARANPLGAGPRLKYQRPDAL